MKIADTISVNPSKTALGQVENPATPIFRSRVIGVERQSNTFNLVSLLFPTNKAGVSEYKKYEVPLRTLLATILIVTGITYFTVTGAGLSMGFAITTLCFGALLAIGLLTRPVMIGAAVYYCVLGALAIRHGSPDVSIFSLMFGCLIFGIIGSGKYSCDALIRKAISRHSKNKTNKPRNCKHEYKVFHNVKY